MMRTLVIGDIHGCRTALAALLRTVQPHPGDQFIFLGDYIDRGPDTRGVIDYLLALAKEHRTVFIRGNHELMMLAAREDPLKASMWQSYGGFEALASYGAEFRSNWQAVIPEAHWDFMEKTARFLETSRHIFVHACVDPELGMADQPDWLLFWEFLDRMQPHRSGKRVICGHSPQRSGLPTNLGFAICIDTGAVAGRRLTCLDVESGHYWQANEKGDSREGAL